MNPHTEHPCSLSAIWHSFWQHRHLIWQLAKREVVGRYRGSVFGLAWSFLHPVVMLVIYTFVFSVVFKAKWGGAHEESRVDFAIVLFIGMIVHGLFAECINRAPGLILANPNYVKKVIFPLEILPWVALGSAVFHALASLAVLLLACLVIKQNIPVTSLWLPVVLFPLLLATLGFSWLLASLGVYLRDIGQITGIATTILLFVSPVFYPVNSLPVDIQPWLMANPLTFIIEQAREVAIWGHAPNHVGLLLYSVGGVLMFWLGYWWFQKTRKGFADVI